MNWFVRTEAQEKEQSDRIIQRRTELTEELIELEMRLGIFEQPEARQMLFPGNLWMERILEIEEELRSM